MNIEPGRIINDFIEPNKKQYSIPVYQRNYEWSEEQCEKLFSDIIKALKTDTNHFCGMVVYAPIKQEKGIDYYVIVDGQQRLTTIYLLIKALIDCAKTERERGLLEECAFNHDKWDEYKIDQSSKLKLKPIKSDNHQLYSLMENHFDKIDKSSGIWKNYVLFKRLIEDALNADENLDVKKIYYGVEKLLCAKIRLDAEDNAQEIFERINSTGIPLSLADQIRNFVLMTDVNQEELYEKYWLEIEKLISKRQMSAFFLDFLNMKLDGYAKESTAYEAFKTYYRDNEYTNQGILEELHRYAGYYYTFLNYDEKYSKAVNSALSGLRQIKQTTVYLFLFRVFEDYEKEVINGHELEEIIEFILNYSIRRMVCEIPSNSLRGLYKTLYSRIFADEKNKGRYVDSVISFIEQITTRDAMPTDDEFKNALKYNNLYGKHALCRFLLINLENQGKEKLITDNLSIEHVMPQNKNISSAWQKMLGENWFEVKERWVHTLGNLTLTGYNSELGDKPFAEKKEYIEQKDTKVVNLYKDIQSCEEWNEDTIQARAERLAEEVLALFPYEEPGCRVSFEDSRYKYYTCENPNDATYKKVSHYELLGERVNVSSVIDIVRSVTKKLYDLDSDPIDRMANAEAVFEGWINPVFSFREDGVKRSIRIPGTDVYMMGSGLSAYDAMLFVRNLLKEYNLNISDDFVFCARSIKEDSIANEG